MATSTHREEHSKPATSILTVALILLITIPSIENAEAQRIEVSGDDMIFDVLGDETCAPTGPPRRIHQQVHANGYTVEVWCEGGQFRLKIIKPDGTVGYAGKCPFPFGQNALLKKVSGTVIVETSNSTVVDWSGATLPSLFGSRITPPRLALQASINATTYSGFTIRVLTISQG